MHLLWCLSAYFLFTFWVVFLNIPEERGKTLILRPNPIELSNNTLNIEKIDSQEKNSSTYTNLNKFKNIRLEVLKKYNAFIEYEAKKQNVCPRLVKAVVAIESAFDPKAKSHKGATGLMQIMPKTGKWLNEGDISDPENNIRAGIKYIKILKKIFNNDRKLVLAAYNSGQGTVQKYNNTIPPIKETIEYVDKVFTAIKLIEKDELFVG